jgi:hypothetical protein
LRLRPQLRRVPAHPLPPDGRVEHLPERLSDAVPGARRKLRLPARDLVRHPLDVPQRDVDPLDVPQRDVAEGGYGVPKPVTERRNRARPHSGRVTLEVQLDERGEREVGQWRGLTG